jgi:hypothetical protein
VKAIGVLEVLGAAGIILPAVFGTAVILVPLAALELGLIMVGAIIMHCRRKEPETVAMNVLLLVLAGILTGRGSACTRSDTSGQADTMGQRCPEQCPQQVPPPTTKITTVHRGRKADPAPGWLSGQRGGSWALDECGLGWALSDILGQR